MAFVDIWKARVFVDGSVYPVADALREAAGGRDYYIYLPGRFSSPVDGSFIYAQELTLCASLQPWDEWQSLTAS